MMCNYYESNAERYAAETFSADMSEQYQRFLPMLKDGAKILDVGSGSGRDACYFQKQGYQVIALEPSKNLCGEIWKVFSGEILCSDILYFFERIDLFLKTNGIIYVSGETGIPTGKAKDGRYFLEFTELLVEKILTANELLRLEQLWYTKDVSGRQGLRWVNVIFEYYEGMVLGLDKI